MPIATGLRILRETSPDNPLDAGVTWARSLPIGARSGFMMAAITLACEFPLKAFRPVSISKSTLPKAKMSSAVGLFALKLLGRHVW